MFGEQRTLLMGTKMSCKVTKTLFPVIRIMLKGLLTLLSEPIITSKVQISTELNPNLLIAGLIYLLVFLFLPWFVGFADF